ncbi:MAG: deoxyhypusine synthase family protein [Proteobacteria bacterium]|nr:deoxyhypusine synthase family protein [Cystobacterineae bacterium]MCL2259413.1 deoxyhypusine synthase family protein [Cystobacterineae bacterium]MCL2314146.1 deoxyhypusine synthase family protein [Pseudomonadota bacterium]
MTKSLKAQYETARSVDPKPISGKETTAQLLEQAFGAYVGRQERIAFELMQRSLQENAAVFLTLSGAMTPAGLHQSCLIPLIESGAISVLSTTGANLYHDAHRVLGHAIREVNPNAGDLQFRLSRIIRIYDLGFWEEVLLDTDKLFSALLLRPEFQRKMTTPQFHFLLGKAMAGIERQLRVVRPSLLSTCYKHAVPIFVGAVQDGSIFLNAVKLKRLLGEAFAFEIDTLEDVFSMAAMQYHCRNHGSKRMAIWILGGGVPKNYTLQGEPLLDQILHIPTDGFDIDLQFCVDPVDNGALSSCPAGEGHTWGKVSMEAVEGGSVYVHADITAVFPWLTHALLSKRNLRRKPMRLMEQMDNAVSALDAAVRRRRKSLQDTLLWEVPKGRPAAKRRK